MASLCVISLAKETNVSADLLFATLAFEEIEHFGTFGGHLLESELSVPSTAFKRNQSLQVKKILNTYQGREYVG